MNQHPKVSEGTQSAVRVQRLINSRRVHTIDEPIPFRPLVRRSQAEQKGKKDRYAQLALAALLGLVLGWFCGFNWG